MRAARRQGMLGVFRCRTGPSSTVRMLAPLLFNTFAAVINNVAYTRFKAGSDIMDALVHLGKRTRAGGRGEATAGGPVLAASL